uniref:Uncharacterized protein n=1 Tax=Hippocampus comes TaxID=109280 RepID=A0A3Q2YW29_HIPCM
MASSSSVSSPTGVIPVSKTWSSNSYLHTQSGYCTSLIVTLPGVLVSSPHAN